MQQAHMHLSRQSSSHAKQKKRTTKSDHVLETMLTISATVEDDKYEGDVHIIHL